MKPEKLEQALNYIRDVYVEEAAVPKKRHPMRWVSAVAAVLALVLLLHTFSPVRVGNTTEAPKMDAPAARDEALEQDSAPAEDAPQEFGTSAVKEYALALASAPRVTEHPNWEEYDGTEAYQEDRNLWMEEHHARSAQLTGALSNLESFFTDSSKLFLRSEDGENRVWSPVNGYIALAMLAEATAGNSCLQILDTLNTENLDTLRSQVSAVWETVYTNSQEGASILSNSLWLDEDVSYRQGTLDNLAYHHYASSYQGDLGSDEMNQALRTWLNEQTGGFLDDSVSDLELNPASVLALASTVYLRSFWSEEFSPELNTEDVFHTPSEDVTCTFMNQYEKNAPYYRGKNFGAVHLALTNGSGMWLFLPDEGTDAAQLVEDGSYMELAQSSWEELEFEYVSLNLSVPKFDIQSSSDLIGGLQEMGITDVFSPDTADFSASIDTDAPVYVGTAQQALRVSIDEEGLEAASYTLLDVPKSAEPQKLPVVDFILDRPFLFVIARSNLPVFTGIVNNP